MEGTAPVLAGVGNKQGRRGSICLPIRQLRRNHESRDIARRRPRRGRRKTHILPLRCDLCISHGFIRRSFTRFIRLRGGTVSAGYADKLRARRRAGHRIHLRTGPAASASRGNGFCKNVSETAVIRRGYTERSNERNKRVQVIEKNQIRRKSRQVCSSYPHYDTDRGRCLCRY